MSDKIRVLVVDDSAFMRIAVKRTLESHPKIEVIGQAKDGADAVAKVAELQPDVVTMDFNMPRMNGVEAVRAIFAKKPVPILMLSAHTQEGAQETLDALAAGAVDFIPKPDGEVSTDLSGVKDELFRKIRAASRSRPRAPAPAGSDVRPVAPKAASATRKARPTSGREKVVLLAVSTGGPAALEKVVPRLPADYPASVLIVQHMPRAFTKALAKRLDGISALDVREAAAGDELAPGQVLIAPGDQHVVFDSVGRLRLNDGPPVHGCRPSADVTLQAASRLLGARLSVIVMTGMGKDGAIGSQAAKAAGARIFAQDKESSIVWGMPKAVVDMGLAEAQLPLEKIAPKMLELG